MTPELPRRCDNKLTCQTCQPAALVLLAWTQDTSIPGRATAVTPQGQCLQMRLKRACRRAIRGFSPFPAPPAPPLCCPCENQVEVHGDLPGLWEEKQYQPLCCRCSAPGNVCSGSTVKQPGFKVK